MKQPSSPSATKSRHGSVALALIAGLGGLLLSGQGSYCHAAGTGETQPAPATATAPAPMTPAAMPALNATPAYAACLASKATKCDVCHVPLGDVSKAVVLSIAKSLLATHMAHRGDYVTLNKSCDLYRPITGSAATDAGAASAPADTAGKAQLPAAK